VLRAVMSRIDLGNLLIEPKTAGFEHSPESFAVCIELSIHRSESYDKTRLEPGSSERSHRSVLKARSSSNLAAQDLLISVLTAELCYPSSDLYMTSPWISDLQILDNRKYQFSAICAAWPPGFIRLSEVLVELAKRKTRVHIVTSTADGSRRFVDRLRYLQKQAGIPHDRIIAQEFSEDYGELKHSKGVIGDSYRFHGSMNFSNAGVDPDKNDESVRLETNSEDVASARHELRREYFS
jgi:hypothetical protein